MHSASARVCASVSSSGVSRSSCSARHSPSERAPNAGRIEALPVANRHFHLLGVGLDPRRQGLQQVVDRLAQVTVVVEAVDHGLDQQAVEIAEAAAGELLAQMIAQRDMGGTGLGELSLAVVRLPRAARRGVAAM